MDPYKARQDVIEKMLLEELEAQSHNSVIYDNETNRSDTRDNEYVPSEHSDQEECDHVSTHETDCDAGNLTTSDESDADSETDGVMKQKMDKFVSCHGNHDVVIGKPGLTAFCENISSLAETLKLFITNDILNKICRTNAEGSS